MVDVGSCMSKSNDHRGYAIAVFVERRVVLGIGLILLRFLARLVSHLASEEAEKPAIIDHWSRGRISYVLGVQRGRQLWNWELSLSAWL